MNEWNVCLNVWMNENVIVMFAISIYFVLLSIYWKYQSFKNYVKIFKISNTQAFVISLKDYLVADTK